MQNLRKIAVAIIRIISLRNRSAVLVNRLRGVLMAAEEEGVQCSALERKIIRQIEVSRNADSIRVHAVMYCCRMHM